jgi:hypothetical protein
MTVAVKLRHDWVTDYKMPKKYIHTSLNWSIMDVAEKTSFIQQTTRNLAKNTLWLWLSFAQTIHEQFQTIEKNNVCCLALTSRLKAFREKLSECFFFVGFMLLKQKESVYEDWRKFQLLKVFFIVFKVICFFVLKLIKFN